jgi:hypothetical protein
MFQLGSGISSTQGGTPEFRFPKRFQSVEHKFGKVLVLVKLGIGIGKYYQMV